MAAHPDLPEENTLARLCGRGRITEDLRPQFDNFRPKVRDGVPEEYLSTDCLEMLNGITREERLSELRRTYPLRRKPRDMFALLNVAKTRKDVREQSDDGRILGFKHVPEDGLPSHCGIFGIGLDDHLIQKIVAESITEMVIATD